MSNDAVNIVVRIMPSGDELDLETPLYTTGKEIKEELLAAGVAPRLDPEGVPYVYDLIFKRKGTKISDDKTLYDLQIEGGDTLFLAPRMNAGC